MKISHQWLTRYLGLNKSSRDIEDALTLIGFEVEGIEKLGLQHLKNVKVGEVVSINLHPQADRLTVCEVNVGGKDGNRQIVCGAKNFKIGDRVAVALPGAELPGGIKIKKSKLRGITSKGMMCSPKELGLSDDHEGLHILDAHFEIGLSINEVLPQGDLVFDIEVTPNRPDCLSYIGIARELGAYFNQDFSYPKVNIGFNEDGPVNNLIKAVQVDTKENCPHYRAYPIEGIKIAPSPDWLQLLLKSVGLRPINNIVDITNFVLHELGHPLHAFDAKKIRGQELKVRLALKGEKIITLDGKDRELEPDMVVIADKERALVIGGIMGSIDAEVDEKTTDVVLEAAYFDPINIRRTSRALGLTTDSSYRYERGVDPCGAENAALRAISMIQEIAGGELISEPYVAGGPVIIERKIELTPEFVHRSLGFNVESKIIKETFGKLKLNVDTYETEDGNEKWVVEIPSFRLDLERPIDLVEEILRIYGTDKIPVATVMTPGLLREDDLVSVFLNKASDYLVGQEFNECSNYSTRNEKELLYWYSNTDVCNLGLDNPLTSDQSHLRNSLIPGLLDSLKLNQSRGNNPMQLFECGRVFKEREGRVWELISVAFIIMQTPNSEIWLVREEPDFHKAQKNTTRILEFAGINLSEEEFTPIEKRKAWQTGHAAETGDFLNGYEIEVGLVSLSMLKNWGIVGNILAGDIYIQPEFLKRDRGRPHYLAFSQFPPTTKDLAILVDSNVLAGKVKLDLEKIAHACINDEFELESVSVFDLYEGRELPKDKKSLAFSLVFRSLERTLTDLEVNRIFGEIQKNISEHTDYEVRS